MKLFSRHVVGAALAGALVCGGILVPQAAAASTPSTVTGAQAVARAKVWSDHHVGYSQSSKYGGYRKDCSGYVSRAWGLPKPGYLGRSFPGVGRYIGKSSIRQGDAMIRSDRGHILMFDRWANSNHTSYWAYEESSSGAVHRVTPYPYWAHNGSFRPLRYNGLR